MLTAQGDDRAVMTESRKESRDGDVRFALVLDECVYCAQINLDRFDAAPVVVEPALVEQYVDDVVNEIERSRRVLIRSWRLDCHT